MGLLVDNFAGGGGASLGIQLAAGRDVDLAINHDRNAVAMHAANHPDCQHFCEDVWTVDPVAVCAGREVDLAWFSPDCKHFSRAKGGKPVEKRIRGLAWVAIKWARSVRPKLIILENVREFQDWGPLDENDRPCAKRKGITFKRFVGNLRSLGYEVEWRELNAADFGAPTHRRRLFLIARCDGEAITWPVPTHGPKCSRPWSTAAECIDWSLPCPSIFERKRPLREKTMQRIARGLKRFVIDAAEPFIVPFLGERDGQSPRVRSIREPLQTVTSKNPIGFVSPYLVRCAHGDKGKPGTKPRWGKTEHAPNDPVPTVTGSNDFAVTVPYVTAIGQNGSRSDRAHPVTEPIRTITSKGEHLLCAAFLAKHFGGVTGVPVNRPLPTITTRGTQTQLAVAFISNQNRADNGTDMRAPLRTVCANNHAAEVRAFLIKYYGSGGNGQDLCEPIHTVTGHDRFGLVTVAGVDYQIVDIGMRMLSPRELARAQGFPDSYKLTGTKTNQVARIGNSVCPPIAAALVRANYRPARKAVVA